MIEGVTIKNEASFDEAGQSLNDLKKINFCYGPNGSGKTTISRVVGNEDNYTDCVVRWQAGNRIQTLVYNRDFVAGNFHPDTELKGIFTLGEHDADIIKTIEDTKIEVTGITEKIANKLKTLKGDDGNGGKLSERSELEREFTDQCWAIKTKYDRDFKHAFAGVRDTKAKFKKRLVEEAKKNKSKVSTFESLVESAATIFADTLSQETSIPPIVTSDLLDLESAEILSKRVIGKDDVNIAEMIQKLKNSDWVQTGRSYFEQSKPYCPFCQQETQEAFTVSLEEYFDEAYVTDISAIDSLATNYETYSSAAIKRLHGILEAQPQFLDIDRFQSLQDIIISRVDANKQHILRKKKEASVPVALETLADVFEEVDSLIAEANQRTRTHNETIENLSKEKQKLIGQIWRFVIDEIKPIYDPYAKKLDGICKAIESIENAISELEDDLKAKSNEIEKLEKQITSINPTVDEINKLLLSFGFVSFSLAQSDKEGFYKIVRPDGEDAKETLSEGERTFITFLYFYHLLRGSNTESGTTEDRVVVFDDPVSSLDSDILFIVSNLIKGLFDDVRDGLGNIKQIIVLTHNIYFHKEICFNKKRGGESAAKHESFWTIKKHQSRSVIESHKSNPIKTSYELLWSEIRDPNRSNLTVQNVLRRIIENYFKILGSIDVDGIANKFEGKDKAICGSLISWMNDGSHFASDDLYVTCDDDTVEKYLEVFKQIFERTGHLGHYNMMMGVADDDHEEEVASGIQVVGV